MDKKEDGFCTSLWRFGAVKWPKRNKVGFQDQFWTDFRPIQEQDRTKWKREKTDEKCQN